MWAKKGSTLKFGWEDFGGTTFVEHCRVTKAFHILCLMFALTPKIFEQRSLPCNGSSAWERDYILILGEGFNPWNMYSAMNRLYSSMSNGLNDG
jgi:hypothetical protein